PAWIREAYIHMNTKSASESNFARALVLWTELERAYGWKTSNKSLGAKNRPEAIGRWLRVDRRVLSKVPTMPPESDYADCWWTWWSGLQPAWRLRSDSGRPTVGGMGAWDDLRIPGKNGMLIVLLSLFWWHDIAVTTRGEWDAALTDVLWVLEQLTNSKDPREVNHGCVHAAGGVLVPRY
ncbi:hypothetical protein C8Q76DRAFT_612154, partial [Earliella scabrosa]